MFRRKPIEEYHDIIGIAQIAAIFQAIHSNDPDRLKKILVGANTTYLKQHAISPSDKHIKHKPMHASRIPLLLGEALLTAAKDNNTAIVSILLSNSIHPVLVSNPDKNPYIFFKSAKFTQLKHSLDLPWQDKNGFTAAHWAVQHNNISMLKLMLSALNFDEDKYLSTVNHTGQTASELAANLYHHECRAIIHQKLSPLDFLPSTPIIKTSIFGRPQKNHGEYQPLLDERADEKSGIQPAYHYKPSKYAGPLDIDFFASAQEAANTIKHLVTENLTEEKVDDNNSSEEKTKLKR